MTANREVNLFHPVLGVVRPTQPIPPEFRKPYQDNNQDPSNSLCLLRFLRARKGLTHG
jgi:hypothetical protein